MERRTVKSSRRMKNSGYVSIGHVLASKPVGDLVKALRHFCTVMFCGLEEEVIHKSSGFWRFDTFFRRVEVTVESFAKFVDGILRKHGADELELQCHIERVAWDMIKFNYDQYVEGQVTRRAIFKLWSIFNRFCDPEQIPLLLPVKSTAFLFQRLGLRLAASQMCKIRTAEDFIHEVVTNPEFNATVIRSITKLYDEVVRFVIIQDRLRFKMIRDATSEINASLKSFMASPGLPKTIFINHKYLIIHEDDISDLDNVGYDNEPNGKVLHKIPLMGVETKIKKSMFSKNSSNVVIKAHNGEVMVELAFNTVKDNYAMFRWTEAVQQAVEMIKECSDPLSKIYQVHDLRSTFFLNNEHAGCPHMLSASQSTINLKDRFLEVPQMSFRRPSAPELNDEDDSSSSDTLSIARLKVPQSRFDDDSKSDSGVEFQDDEVFPNVKGGAVSRRKASFPKRKYGIIIHLDGLAGSTIVTTREE